MTIMNSQTITQIKNVVFNKNSVPVTNNSDILKWLVDCQTNSYLNKQKNLSQNLVDELTSIFGSSNKTLRLEFMMKVWILQYKDLTFNIFTAKGKGTYIEIVGYSYDDINKKIKQNDIIKFLEELHSLINKLN